MHTLAAILPEFISRHLGWWLFGIIMVVGLIAGARDLARLSFKRIWAISGVCFDESIRRRVLWITPLAILGVIIVSQLQRPLDEQDAIRQTIKFSLFATGMLVALTTIILACTNLPREIDNRVIYTIVTKPTTRLEIVLGKVIGFAKVSLAILVIMGIFTGGYLTLRAWSMHKGLVERLQNKDTGVASVGTLEYYRDAGLLTAKTLLTPDELQLYARPPWETGTRRYEFGNGEGQFLIPFDVTPEMLIPRAGAEPGQVGLLVLARVGYVKESAAGEAEKPKPATQAATTGPTTVPYYGPFIVPPEVRATMMRGSRPSGLPTVSIDVMDVNQNSIGPAAPVPPRRIFELIESGVLTEQRAIIDPRVAKQLKGRIYIRIVCNTPGFVYFIDVAPAGPPPVEIKIPKLDEHDQPAGLVDLPPARAEPGSDAPAPVIYQTRSGTFGQQLRGGAQQSPIAVYTFRNAGFDADSNDDAPFELRAGIERSGAEEELEAVAVLPTKVAVSIRNLTTQQLSAETIVQPESNRTIYFRMPAKALAGGNFEVLLRGLTAGDFVGLQDKSLVLIMDRQPFIWNLAKSLLILWLMAVLITAVAIFTSTFLSWPIAVVLTIVILLGHWGVEQLGDATAPGVGRQVVNDFNLRSSAKAEAISATVEKLSSFLNVVSTVLPDINAFPAVEDIERGIAIPPAKLRAAAGVALGFGLPLVLLAYLVLKNKEVAP